MKILLINPPYLTLTSRIGVGHQIPLGLLMVGGSLLDAGHEVKLLDAERRHLPIKAIIEDVGRFSPDMVMTGHAGSTPAHPICVRMLKAIKRAFPDVITVYGGVYPTFHAEEILHYKSYCAKLKGMSCSHFYINTALSSESPPFQNANTHGIP